MTFDKERAKKIDLVDLPSEIPGTRCGNCFSYDDGYCTHKKVQMNVGEYQCCFFWNRPDAPVATSPENKQMNKDTKSRMQKLYEDIYFSRGLDKRRNGDIARFSDCGHDKDGDFSKGNTCASSGKKKKIDKYSDTNRKEVTETYSGGVSRGDSSIRFKRLKNGKFQIYLSGPGDGPMEGLSYISDTIEEARENYKKVKEKLIKQGFDKLKYRHTTRGEINNPKSIKRTTEKFGIMAEISRFSDCGHTKDGEFDHGNTCANLRGKGKSEKVKVKKHIREFSDEEKSEMKDNILKYLGRGGSHMLRDIRQELGHEKHFDAYDPMKNPVNFLMKQLADEGKVERVESEWGGSGYFKLKS